MTFASRKSRIRAPLHRRTEEIGACLGDPFANGEGGENLIRSPSQKGAGGGCIDPMGNLGNLGCDCQPTGAAPTIPAIPSVVARNAHSYHPCRGEATITPA